MKSINKIVIIISGCLLFCLSCSSEPDLIMKKPRALSVGDTIAFCAPSGFLDSIRMSLAKIRLEDK